MILENSPTNPQIERYLNGELSSSEMEAFEQVVLQDPQLAEELQQYVKATASIEALGSQQLYDELRTLGDSLLEETPVPKVKPIRRVPYLAIAAAITLLFAIAFLFWPPASNSVSPETLFTQNFNYLPAPSGNRSVSQSDENWALGTKAYIQEDYAGALKYWSLSNNESDDPLQYLYLGMVYLKADSISAATENLLKVQSESLYHPEAQWYLALTHLKAGNIPEAKAALTEIANSQQHYQRDRAEIILSKL